MVVRTPAELRAEITSLITDGAASITAGDVRALLGDFADSLGAYETITAAEAAAAVDAAATSAVEATANAANTTANAANTTANAANATANAANTAIAALMASTNAALALTNAAVATKIAGSQILSGSNISIDRSGGNVTISGTGSGGGSDVDYDFIQALPLHSVPSGAQFIVARPGDEGGGDLVAAVPRAIFDRLHTDNPDRFLPRPLQPDRNVFINSAGKIDFGPILNAHTIFPGSSVVPDHTADDAPELFYLDHPITTGPRDDATVVPGYWNFSPSIPFPTIGSASVGFTTYFTPHIGSLNRDAGSLAEIIGAVHEGDAHHDDALNVTTLRPGGIFSQQQINSHSESWLTAWSTVLINGTEYGTGAVLHSGGVWYRNILDFPDHLTGNFTLNFKNSADEYYYTGAGRITTHPAGWYTRSSNGYSLIAGFAAVHPSGRGAPTELPDFPGQPYTNNLGDLWIGAGESLNVQQDAAGAFTPLTRGPLAVGLYRRINAGTDSQFAVLVGNGGFSWAFFADFEGNSIFRQAQGVGGGDVVMTTWAHVWQYLNATHPNDVQAARAHDHSIFLGVFTSHQDALDRYDTRYTQALFDSGDTDIYYGIRTDDTNDTANPLGGIHQLTAFTAAHVTVDNSALHWVGPFWTENKFANWFDNNAPYIASGLTAAGYTFGGGGLMFGTTVEWTYSTNTNRVQMPHGLSRIPDGMITDLICIVADKGYPVGHVIPNLSFPWRVALSYDDTNVIIQPATTGNRFGIASYGTGPGSGSDFTNQRWQYRLKPYTIDALDP